MRTYKEIVKNYILILQTFTLYSAGVLTKGQTLEALKIKKLYNQLVLSSENGTFLSQFYRDSSTGGIINEGRKIWR